MARPVKSGVDYFPHDIDATSRKTLYTLEASFGNDGYAFWFKLLELIGSQDGLFYDCNNQSDWMFLIAKTRVDEITAAEILATLSKLGAIDSELWEHKIIWVQKLVDRLKDVYKKRKAETPRKPSFCTENPTTTEVTAAISTQSKVKEITPIVPANGDGNCSNLNNQFETFWKVYPKKIGKGAAEKAFKKHRPGNDLLQKMLISLDAQSKSLQWTRDSGQYIPNPATWLNQRRWEDETALVANDTGANNIRWLEG